MQHRRIRRRDLLRKAKYQFISEGKREKEKGSDPHLFPFSLAE
jgi:hypothetical protein